MSSVPGPLGTLCPSQVRLLVSLLALSVPTSELCAASPREAQTPQGAAAQVEETASEWLLGVTARKLVVMAPRGQGCTSRTSRFSRLYDNHGSEWHQHGKGEGSSSLLTAVSSQRKERASRPGRKVRVDKG